MDISSFNARVPFVSEIGANVLTHNRGFKNGHRKRNTLLCYMKVSLLEEKLHPL